MNKKYIYSIVLVVILILVFVFSRQSHQTATMKIGVVGPFTGNAAFFGDYIRRGLELAKNEIDPNTLAKLQIIQEDDRCYGKDSVTAVQKLITVDRVKYVIGPLCNEGSLATEKLFEDNKVLSLTIGLPSNEIANMGPYHFSFSPEIEYLMKAIAQEFKIRGLNKVAVIHTDSAFYDENYRHFKKYFTEGGGTIVSDQTVRAETIDFRDAILKMKQAKPDSLMLIAHTAELNNILKQINAQGMIKLPKFGIHSAETGVLLEVKDLADGLIYPYPGDRSTIGSSRSYETDYQARYETSADPYSANVYDSLKILTAAINDCGYENTECVRQKLAALKDYSGANGSLSVDHRGVGTYKEIQLKMFYNGEFKPLVK